MSMTVNWNNVRDSIKNNTEVFGPRVRQIVLDAEGEGQAVAIVGFIFSAAVAATIGVAISLIQELLSIQICLGTIGASVLALGLGALLANIQRQRSAKKCIAQDETSGNFSLLKRLREEDAREVELSKISVSGRAQTEWILKHSEQYSLKKSQLLATKKIS